MPPETIKRVAAAPLASEQKPSPSPTPTRISTPIPATPPSPYPEYDDADVAANTTTPELIKVKRSKKKKKGVAGSVEPQTPVTPSASNVIALPQAQPKKSSAKSAAYGELDC